MEIYPWRSVKTAAWFAAVESVASICSEWVVAIVVQWFFAR